MSKQLQAVAIAAPGFFGLNTQQSGAVTGQGFALKAENCVIDKYGRLGSRNGWSYVSTAKDTVADANVGVNLKGLTRFLDVAGVETYISWSDDKFYTGISDLTTVDLTGVSDTITTGNWQAASLNDHQYFFQSGYKPLLYTYHTGSVEFLDVDSHAHSSGTAPKGNTVLSAYGRLWVADLATEKTTVYFSDVLDGAKWNTGTAGSLDISAVLTKGTDQIVALGAHNGNLVIFCRDSIIIYEDGDNFQGSFDTASLTLVEVIQGVGCVARDSVQGLGDDILFLSANGVRSLSRVIQEKSQPLSDVSRNVQDDIVQLLRGEISTSVKSVYSASNSFYLISFLNSGSTYCFDTRGRLEDGSFRVLLWTEQTANGYLDYNGSLYLAEDNGYAKYTGHSDNGSSYRMTYYTTYLDLGEPSSSKFVKRISATTIGATGQTFVMKVGYDYNDQYNSYPFITRAGGLHAEYGLAEYNIGEYSTGTLIDNIQAPAGGSGTVLQVAFESDIDGAELSLQKISVYVKLGKIT
jgi:hypothetical protein